MTDFFTFTKEPKKLCAKCGKKLSVSDWSLVCWFCETLLWWKYYGLYGKPQPIKTRDVQ